MTAKTPTCPHCGAEAERRVGQTYCTACGQRLPELPTPPALPGPKPQMSFGRAFLLIVGSTVILGLCIICSCYLYLGYLTEPAGTDDADRVTGQPTQELTGTPQIPETVPPATDTPPPSATQPPAGTPAPVSQRTEAQVIRVVDGDTIEVSMDGQAFTVRYIGSDTPETVHPEKPVEWMGPEASAANKELVGGKVVYLEKDISEIDHYDRLLRYVFLADGTFVNAELVRLGYAQVSTYPPDVKYQDLLVQMQQEARDHERGLWGLTPTPVLPTASPATETAMAPTAIRRLPPLLQSQAEGETLAEAQTVPWAEFDEKDLEGRIVCRQGRRLFYDGWPLAYTPDRDRCEARMLAPPA
jgi:endonuclease YncB( thermonuclease family)